MNKTHITITVLSEEPIGEHMDLADVVRECDQGDFVLYSTKSVTREISDYEMARALLEAGSDPGFFQLDHIEVKL